MRNGRPDFDKPGLAFPEGVEPLPKTLNENGPLLFWKKPELAPGGRRSPKDIMRNGRPDFEKPGLAISLKNP